MSKYVYPQLFEKSFGRDFINAIEKEIPTKEFINDIKTYKEAGLISGDRKLDPLYIITSTLGRFGSYFNNDINVANAIMTAYKVLETAPKDKTLDPGIFTHILIECSVINEKHRQIMINYMEAAWMSAYKIIKSIERAIGM